MPDLPTTIAIASLALAAIGTLIAYLMLRRTPKPPKPPITPTCVTIMGVTMDRGPDLFGRR